MPGNLYRKLHACYHKDAVIFLSQENSSSKLLLLQTIQMIPWPPNSSKLLPGGTLSTQSTRFWRSMRKLNTLYQLLEWLPDSLVSSAPFGFLSQWDTSCTAHSLMFMESTWRKLSIQTSATTKPSPCSSLVDSKKELELFPSQSNPSPCAPLVMVQY